MIFLGKSDVARGPLVCLIYFWVTRATSMPIAYTFIKKTGKKNGLSYRDTFGGIFSA